MSSEKVQIHLSSSAEIGAYTQVNSALLGFGKTHDKVIGAAQRSVTALNAVFKNDLTASISTAVSMLDEVKKAGIWGVVGFAVTKGLTALWNKLNENKIAAKKLREEYEAAWKKMGDGALSAASSIEKAFSRIEAKEKAAVDRMKNLRDEFYAEQELAKQRDIAAGGTGEGQDNATRMMKRADAEEDAARRITAAREKLTEAEKNERRALRRAVNARTGSRLGADTGLAKAEEALEKAKAATESARAELANAEAHARAVDMQNQADIYKTENDVAAKKREAEKKAAEEREKEAERIAEEEEKARIARIDAETKAAEIQKRQHAEWLRARADSFKGQIDAARKAAEEWEKSAEKMRGKTLNAWMAEESNGGKSADAAARRFARANAESDRRASRIRMNARHGWASSSEREWLGKYDAWKAAQNPANNPALQSVRDLEAKRAAAVEDIAAFVKKIGEDIGTAISVG